MPESPVENSATGSFVTWAPQKETSKDDHTKISIVVKDTGTTSNDSNTRTRLRSPPPQKIARNSSSEDREMSVISSSFRTAESVDSVLLEDTFGATQYQSDSSEMSSDYYEDVDDDCRDEMDSRDKEDEEGQCPSSNKGGILHLDIVKPSGPEVVKDQLQELQDDFVKEWLMAHQRFRQPAIIDGFSSSDDSTLDSSFEDEIPMLLFCGKCCGPIEIGRKGKRKKTSTYRPGSADIPKLAECRCYETSSGSASSTSSNATITISSDRDHL